MCVENEIDGEAVMMLVKDHTEFCQIVTKPVARLRIKKLVCEAESFPDEYATRKPLVSCLFYTL